MTVAANSSGVVVGKFTIPSGIPAGAKDATFLGANGSFGRASFFGQGTQIDEVRQIVTQITTTLWRQNVDPLAQTFTMTEATQLEAVDLYFTEVGTTTVAVQIRETLVGYPTRTVIAEARIEAAALTAGAWNKFTFRSPARLEAGTEYALVVLCNDADSALGMAQLGKYDDARQQWVTSQPYTVGVLLASSNASTWTAFQDRDLAFRLYARQYTETSRLVDLGAVNLAGATEVLALTLLESPSNNATGDLELTLPDGTIVKSGDNQRIPFAAPTTGTVNVRARLRADQNWSAAQYPGTQIIQGIVQTTGTYVSNAVNADAAGCTVIVLIDAIIPSGSTVGVEVSGVDAGDTYSTMPALGVPILLNNQDGLYEYAFQKTAVMEARVKVRLTLTGTLNARPRVRNLRVIVL